MHAWVNATSGHAATGTAGRWNNIAGKLQARERINNARRGAARILRQREITLSFESSRHGHSHRIGRCDRVRLFKGEEEECSIPH